ncbi:MAG: AMP-binding protein, partial [Myxococcota bacterium]|nr:AMP-binding protein [Myxococcota bacterium]
EVGQRVSQMRQQGDEPTGLLALKYAIADRLVFSKLRATFGGRLRFFISGSAPLSRDMAQFFHAAGLLILEGYGLTESSAATFVNRLDNYRFGTVGQALDGVEVRLEEADGEILVRSRGVMRGYHEQSEASAQTITEDGWLRTGDIGTLDADGYLTITDRKKDLIKTSGGKYVAPQELENRLKALCPYTSQVLVHGDRRNYCTALLTLNEDAVRSWANAQEEIREDMSYEELSRDDRIKDLIQPYVDKLNAELPSYSTIKKFALLPSDLTIEAGELTPTMKVKRKRVEEIYMQVLDGFYDDAMARI